VGMARPKQGTAKPKTKQSNKKREAAICNFFEKWLFQFTES